MRRAVFLDRDGVISENRDDYVKSWQEFAFLPGVFEPLVVLAQTSFLVVVVSNQSAINRGLVNHETVQDIHRRMRRAVEDTGGRLDAITYCPHRPDEDCDCRKPKPGMLLQTARELDIDLARSYLVGDALSDMQAALAVQCKPVLVLTGRGRSQHPLVKQTCGQDVVTRASLLEAVDWILRDAETCCH